MKRPAPSVKPHVPFLINAVVRSLQKTHRGPLAKFTLFDGIMAVWLASNRPTAAVIETYELTKPDPMHDARRRRLGAKLVQLIENDDVAGLRKVIKTVEYLRKSKHEPLHPRFATVLKFFRRHANEHWTFREIQQHLRAETGIESVEGDRTLQRWCKAHRFPIAPGKRTGRPKNK